MEKVLREPIELTEFELDAVAGGNPFSSNITAVANSGNAVTSSQGFIGVDAVVATLIANAGLTVS